MSDNKKIEVAEVEAVSGAPRGELVRQLLSSLAKKDAAAALKTIGHAVAANMDARTLAKLLIHRMRTVLLLRYAPDLAETLREQHTAEDIALAASLSKAWRQFRHSAHASRCVRHHGVLRRTASSA